ncbi:MAG TPA: hypothetical protein VM866_06980 [Pyrinomonadaceae bacterium]|jgi:hypothetical protein|nr:hypothetical protein [Pyrinomonadaceae bacterium]
MNQLQLFQEISATYRRHGWRLARVLMRDATLAQLHTAATGTDALLFDNVAVKVSEVDALWFARASQEGREAWELRHVADAPYALFELFEADEEEEDREDVRREMESLLIEKTNSETSREEDKG